MTKEAQLPSSWHALFDGDRLADKIGETALLSTVDEAGWPHLAFLSLGEVVAKDRAKVVIATWPRSRTTANMVRTGRAALYAAAEGVVWETRLEVTPLNATLEFGPALTSGEIVEVRRHEAPYAYLDALASFRLNAPEPTLERWIQQVEEMKRRL
ncbi:MAG: pyridoxamine 5'-phosphate oxidase family protein [Caulobacteraceae bacterium]